MHRTCKQTRRSQLHKCVTVVIAGSGSFRYRNEAGAVCAIKHVSCAVFDCGTLSVAYMIRLNAALVNLKDMMSLRFNLVPYLLALRRSGDERETNRRLRGRLSSPLTVRGRPQRLPV